MGLFAIFILIFIQCLYVLFSLYLILVLETTDTSINLELWTDRQRERERKWKNDIIYFMNDTESLKNTNQKKKKKKTSKNIQQKYKEE